MAEINNSCKDTDECGIEYSVKQVWLDNVPYITMILLGAYILWQTVSLFAGVMFVLYGITGTLWFIVFICPYCHYYGSKACPCGYGVLSLKITKKKDAKKFHSVFKRNILAIVPLWIIPPVAAVMSLLNVFSISLLTWVLIFVIDSCIILPWVSRKYGCAHCPNKEECPWMQKGIKKN